jgi:hypothetical protein
VIRKGEKKKKARAAIQCSVIDSQALHPVLYTAAQCGAALMSGKSVMPTRRWQDGDFALSMLSWIANSGVIRGRKRIMVMRTK